jgi:hypothetical protein
MLIDGQNLTGLNLSTANLEGVLRDLNVEEDKIQKVITALGDSSTDLADGSFESARIPSSAFGGSPRGLEFGDHHGKAQQVTSDTIRGMTTDLESFRDGVQNAVRLVRSADETSAEDLYRKREIADGLQRVWKHSAGDRANRDSRNEHLGGGHRDYDAYYDGAGPSSGGYGGGDD